MLKPNSFGWYHMMWLLITVVSVILILVFTTQKNTTKQTRIFLIVFAVVMYIGEIHKQIVYSLYGDYGSNFTPHFPWETVPLHFCGTPLYVVPLALVTKNKKLKDACLTYLATFAFIGGFGAMLFPGEAYRDRLGNNIQTMVHHYFMIICAAFLWRSGQIKSFKSFLHATYMFMVFLTIAVLLNTFFHHLSRGVINVFYLNPYKNDPTIIPVISKLIANQDLYVVGLLLYTVTFIGAAFLLFLLAKYLNKFVKYISKISKNVFSHKGGFLVISAIFFLGTVIYPVLLYNNYFFPTVDFARLSLGTRLNSLFGDLLFFVIVFLIICYLFKTKLWRTVAVLCASFLTSLLVFAQMVIAYHYNLLISFDTLTIIKNPADEMGMVMTINFLQLLFERSWHLAFLPFVVNLIFAILYFKKNKILFINTVCCRKLLLSTNSFEQCDFLRLVKQKTFSFFGVLLVVSLFQITQGVGRNYINYKWQVSASRQTLELQTSGYTAGFITGAIIGTSHQDNEKINYDYLKQFNRNPNKTNRKDGFASNITDELSGVSSSNIKNLADLQNVFRGRNIFLIELETFPAFMLGETKGHIFYNYKEQIYPHISKLLKQSYFLENFYDSTGVGHTSDAMFSVHYGLPMVGNYTMSWHYANKQVNNENILSKHLLASNYQTLAYNPGTLDFYNLGSAFNKLLNYQGLIYADPKTSNPNHILKKDLLNDFKQDLENNSELKTHYYNQYQYQTLLQNDYEYKTSFTKYPRKYILSDQKYQEHTTQFDNLREKYIKQQWGIDDRLGLKILSEIVKDNLGVNETEKKLLSFYSTALPHIPFAKLREEDKAFGDDKLVSIYRDKGRQKLIKQNPIQRPVDDKGNRLFSPIHDNLKKMYRSDYNCLQSIGYHDRVIKYFLDYLLPNTKNSVFIFYGDHTATSFRKKSLEITLNRKLTRAEYRSWMKRTAAWVYVPDYDGKAINGVYPGLVTGVQKNLRSQHDIKDTILNLLGINHNYFSLAHNLFTSDKEIYIDPKTMSVFSDHFLAQVLNPSPKNTVFLTNKYNHKQVQEFIKVNQKLKYELEKVLLSGDFEKLNLLG